MTAKSETQKAGKYSYVDYKREHTWKENSLAGSDEDIGGDFDWRTIGKFGPYVAKHKLPALAGVVLMLLYTVFSLANPYLIGVAIDKYISGGDLRGLAQIGGVLLAVNIAMWLS